MLTDKYWYIFRRHNGPVLQMNGRPLSEYPNAYKRREIPVTIYLPLEAGTVLRTEHKKEYVFRCPLKLGEKTSSFYVSKAYGALSGPRSYRFVFLQFERFHNAMLAERSAEVCRKADFNVELHYLELRKHNQPITIHHDHDPVADLVTGEDENDQLFRLCTIVLSSSYFRGRVKYPARIVELRFRRGKIWFRTEEGIEEAAGNTYHEVMVRCYAQTFDEDTKLQWFYISRAYNPNQVFVYEDDPTDDGKFYLENLSFNVNIVHELYRLGDVEI